MVATSTEEMTATISEIAQNSEKLDKQNLVAFLIDLDPPMPLMYKKYNDILISIST